MGWFGPSKDDVWRQLCEEIGADFIQGGFWKGNKVQARVGPWTITLDVYTESHGESSATYTRIRAPYVNPSGFRFSVYRRGLFSDLGKLLGLQDIEIGDPAFDEAFIVKGNKPDQVRELLASPQIRQLIQSQPKISLEVRDSEGWLGPQFPPDVDELQFRALGVLKDLDRLKSLFALFAALLDQLHRMGSAQDETPGVTL